MVFSILPSKSNELISLSVKVGDKVLYRKYGGTEINHDGKDYLILSENDVMAIGVIGAIENDSRFKLDNSSTEAFLHSSKLG
jgi:hypothetical protein